MTFNYANNLSADQKTALSLGHSRLTAFSDSSITTLDNGDDDFMPNNGENEIYLDSSVPTAQCVFYFINSTCTVLEADMRYGNEPWTTTDDSQHHPYGILRSMTGTAIHEGGHCLGGMQHSNDIYNMMGAEYSHVTRQGTDAYYGPGEDLSAGMVFLHGEKSGGLDSFRDVGITAMRYSHAGGQYSQHTFGFLRDPEGARLPIVASYVGQFVYQVAAGATIQMETTAENNGEADVENPNIGFYLSTNDIISSDDVFLGEVSSTLGRDTPLEAITNVTIPGGTAPGNYFLGAYIDHDSLISETTVANNAAYYPVSVVSALPLPTVTTNPATVITVAGATLNATVNPNGLSTTVHFDYGTTTAYGSTATYGDIGSGTSVLFVEAPVSRLNCGTTYHFRARGVSSAGSVFGSDGTFTTGACSTGC